MKSPFFRTAQEAALITAQQSALRSARKRPSPVMEYRSDLLHYAFLGETAENAKLQHALQDCNAELAELRSSNARRDEEIAELKQRCEEMSAALKAEREERLSAERKLHEEIVTRDGAMSKRVNGAYLGLQRIANADEHDEAYMRSKKLPRRGPGR